MPLAVARFLRLRSIMDLNSPLFDRIRVKPRARTLPRPPDRGRAVAAIPVARPGIYKAPKGRDHEGEYFAFCADHVREYNATYDYFKGMDDDALAKYRSAGGDRPPSHLENGAEGAARAARPTSTRPFMPRRAPCAARARDANRRRGEGPRYNALALKALFTLELDGHRTEATIKTKYKELVKRHHPDVNGGDRSSEDKLREIIQAYNFLRSNKLV